MFKKILLPLLFLIIVNNCDYSPVYLKSENSKLNINIIEIKGDTEINKVIVNEISEIANNIYSKKIDIKSRQVLFVTPSRFYHQFLPSKNCQNLSDADGR